MAIEYYWSYGTHVFEVIQKIEVLHCTHLLIVLSKYLGNLCSGQRKRGCETDLFRSVHPSRIAKKRDCECERRSNADDEREEDASSAAATNEERAQANHSDGRSYCTQGHGKHDPCCCICWSCYNHQRCLPALYCLVTCSACSVQKRSDAKNRQGTVYS